MSHLELMTDSPRLEAEILLVHILECSRVFLLAHPETPMTSVQCGHYAEVLARRSRGEPLPYITGHMEFYGLDFAVTPDVLIPRPETEGLVEGTLAWLRSHENGVVVDVGTGSGCIVVTLAAKMPTARYIATDISASALEVARANAHQHQVTESIAFLQADLLSPLLGAAGIDVIVSNPPYIAEREWDELSISVRREPRVALTAGLDGLDAIRALLRQAHQALRPGGLLLVEIGEKQGNAVQALARAAFPEARVEVLQDLAGKDRVLKIDSLS